MPAIKGKIPKIGGWQGACTLIPLAAFLDLLDLSEQIEIAIQAKDLGHKEAVRRIKEERKRKGGDE